MAGLIKMEKKKFWIDEGRENGKEEDGGLQIEILVLNFSF